MATAGKVSFKVILTSDPKLPFKTYVFPSICPLLFFLSSCSFRLASLRESELMDFGFSSQIQRSGGRAVYRGS